jgi:hypothetical protein
MRKTKVGIIVATLFAALFGLACGHTQANAVAFEAPSSERDVIVLTPATPPHLGRPLGAVSASGEGGPLGNDARALYAELVRQTHALGGNALVLESMGAAFDDSAATFSGPSNGCGASCIDSVGYAVTDETLKVALRGKALLLSPEERASLEPASTRDGVGLVQAFGTGTKATRGEVLRLLRERGDRMGCDEIVHVTVDVGAKNAHAIGVCARRAAEERGADARNESPPP